MANPYESESEDSGAALKESARAAYGSAKEGAEAVRDTAKEQSERLAQEAEAELEEGRASLDEMVTKAEFAIIDHPLAAVGLAFAAGWVTSKLFR